MRDDPLAKRYKAGGYFFDFENNVFTVSGEEIELDNTEIRVLRMLTVNEGIAITDHVIASMFWRDVLVVDAKRLLEKMKIFALKLSAGAHLKYEVDGYVWRGDLKQYEDK